MSAQGQTAGRDAEQEIRRLDAEMGRAIVGRIITSYTSTAPWLSGPTGPVSNISSSRL